MVLIVEDDPIARGQFAQALVAEGYTVHTAADAPTALAAMGTTAPDAILLDLRLPVIDGLELLRQVRALEPARQTPVAIVTGQAVDDGLEAELHDLGAQIWYKPLWLDELVRLVLGLVSPTRQ